MKNRKRRYPQYVLMLDLLMWMLFIFIESDITQDQGIRYRFTGASLHTDCQILWYRPPEPTVYFDAESNKWKPASGAIDPGDGIFVSVDATAFLPKPTPSADQLLIAINGKLADKVRRLQFDSCAKGRCNNLIVEIDGTGNVRLDG